MALPIERYGLLGDLHTAALVGDDGSVDWMCAPRFDSDAVFAALLGTPDHGRWLLGAKGEVRRRSRQYRPGTLVLETVAETSDGILRVTDCMQPRTGCLRMARVATCTAGRVPIAMDLRPRFEYGSIRPWTRRRGAAVAMTAGAGTLELLADVPVAVGADAVTAEATLDAGQSASFVLAWHPSHEPPPPTVAAARVVDEAERFWRAWSARAYQVEAPWQEAVARSLITVKALTYAPTGGILGAPTTSLPECLRGVRNWDYRFCWIRDATFALESLLSAGYVDEAEAWCAWLLRSAAGHPDEMHVLYAPDGARRLTETEASWLPGYDAARPVRIGNAAGDQFQLDMCGEILSAFRRAREAHRPPADTWDFERALVEHVERVWRRADKGIWELRTEARHLTHSKVMAWRAVDSAIRTVEQFGATGPLARWQALRAQIHADVLEHGYDAERQTFVQEYGGRELDAALLRIPLVGFLPPTDPRVLGTIEAVRHELSDAGLVRRYRTGMGLDGLPPGEGAFLPCSFWLVDALALAGRRDEAGELFEKLLGLRNDVGLLAEEYDVGERRLVGNFPQTFTHVSLVNSAGHLRACGAT